MKFKIFAIFDNKAKCYSTPFFLSEEGQAVRHFTDMANDPDHSIGKHPEDYTLFRIGAYADNTAAIEPSEIPFSLGNGLDCQNQK